MSAEIEWFEVGERMPVADAPVMLFNTRAAEPVWFGRHDGHRWRNSHGLIAVPTHWAARPMVPTV
jgi:hypothetical protein